MTMTRINTASLKILHHLVCRLPAPCAYWDTLAWTSPIPLARWLVRLWQRRLSHKKLAGINFPSPNIEFLRPALGLSLTPMRYMISKRLIHSTFNSWWDLGRAIEAKKCCMLRGQNCRNRNSYLETKRFETRLTKRRKSFKFIVLCIKKRKNKKIEIFWESRIKKIITSQVTIPTTQGYDWW